MSNSEKITSFLNEYFSPEIEWEMAHIEYNSKAVGFIYTRESENKPVISKKNKDNVIRSGEIYYRYRAQTKCIEYGELRQIIDEIKEKEQYNWIRIFKDIAKIGPENVEINKKSNIEIKPSNNPKAIPVIVTEENLRKLYPWNHKQLISELKNRYENFKINQDFHKMKKKLLQNKEYGFTKKLDPNNPKTPKQDLYSPAILKEFDKIYKRR